MMKRNERRNRSGRGMICVTSIALALALVVCGLGANDLFFREAYAEAVQIAEPMYDPSPAIYVTQKNANSVVGVIANKQDWNRSTGAVEETMYSQGSGVVVKEGGYILTNYHVIEGGDSYKVLMPDGEKADAVVSGSDSSLDLAVLQVVGEAAKKLVPVSIGSTANLPVGSTVIAIGNPGGEVLANTVTQGIVSALERSSVNGGNTTRNVDYIQHDAAINSGNSGGGLFDYRGNLVGINNLKYGGSAYSRVSIEGLGFAIPVDTAYPIAMQLIENGSVIRPQMGVNVIDYEGPEEPMANYAPASVCVESVEPGSPAERAGMKQFDFIYSINGKRVKSFRELTGVIDHFKAGDTITVTVVRYNTVYPVTASSSNYYNDPFGSFFGGFGGYAVVPSQPAVSTELAVGGGFDYVTMDIVLELPAETEAK